MEEIVFLNGKFLPRGQAGLTGATSESLYGWGLFETMRWYNNKIVYFDRHLRRIKDSSKLIAINFYYPLARLKKYIEETVKINDFCDAWVRLILLKKSGKTTDTLITVKKYLPFSVAKYSQGFSCAVSPLKQNQGSLLANLKTTDNILSKLSYLAAQNKGFDEAIILNNRGYLAEASRSNIFFARDNEIFTPALECGCLDGITRKVVFDIAGKQGIKIYPGNFTLGDLYTSDEAFLTNSLMGVMSLRSVENHFVGGRSPKRKFTRFFMEKYNLLLGQKV